MKIVLLFFPLTWKKDVISLRSYMKYFRDWARFILPGCKKKKKKNFIIPFYGWYSTASRLLPLRGGSLLFTTKFPDIPDTHFTDLGRMKG